MTKIVLPNSNICRYSTLAQIFNSINVLHAWHSRTLGNAHAHNASLPKISSIMQINIYIERELSEVHFRKRQLMNSLFYSKKICCVFCIYEMSIRKERTTCRDSWHPKFLVQKKWIFISAQVYSVHCTLCTHTVRLDHNHSWFEHFIYRNGKYLQVVCHATNRKHYIFESCKKFPE